MEFLQGLQLEKSEVPIRLEEADNVFFAQGVNMRWAYVITSLATRQNVKGKYLDRILGLDRKSTRLNSSHVLRSRMPSSA